MQIPTDDDPRIVVYFEIVSGVYWYLLVNVLEKIIFVISITTVRCNTKSQTERYDH